MATDYEFPANRELIFPDRCVCCGKPKEAETAVKVSRLIQEKRSQVNRSASLQVPLCFRCKRTDQRIFLLSLGSFVLGLAGVGVACFLLLSYWDTRLGIMSSLGANTIPGNPGTGVLIILSISFIVGVGGGFLLEAILKALLIPFVGKALYYAPIMAIQLLGDVEYTAGLQARLSKDAKSIQLRFFNDNVASDFGALNH
jgi:predicted lysophospholipase L1 biosynthesis ABC-type transport system permease subunit